MVVRSGSEKTLVLNFKKQKKKKGLKRHIIAGRLYGAHVWVAFEQLSLNFPDPNGIFTFIC